MPGNYMDITQVDKQKYQSNRAYHPLKVHFSNFSWQIIKDQLALIILFIFAVVAVYFLPQSLSKILFLGVLILFWISKKDYLWFAFFFILVEQPGYFFTGFSQRALYSLPTYTLMPSMAFTVIDLFVIVALIKAILKGKRTKLELEKPLILILVYVSFSVCVSIINGATIAFLANILRGPFYYTIIISFLYLIKNRKEAYSFIILITPVTFFLLFTQVYYLIVREGFVNLFYPNLRRTYFILGTDELRAIPGGYLLLFFSFIFSLFLLEDKINKISKKYLFSIIGISYLSFIISTTRVWFVVLSFIFIGYVFISKKKISDLMKIGTVSVVIVIILILSGITSVDFYQDAVIPSLGEVASVATGDFASVPTFEHRYFFRLPKLLEGVKKFLFFGSGFSEDYYKYRDFHVGFFNTLLQFGIFGFLFFLYLYMKYFSVIKKTEKKLDNVNPLKTSIKLLSIIFSGILLANFTTWYFFPMDGHTNIIFFIALFLSLTEFFVREGNNVGLPKDHNESSNLREF